METVGVMGTNHVLRKQRKGATPGNKRVLVLSDSDLELHSSPPSVFVLSKVQCHEPGQELIHTLISTNIHKDLRK